MAQRTRQQLQERGEYRVTGCIDAKNAEPARLRGSGADVFILDGAMPYWDGAALAQALSPLPCVILAPGGLCARGPENARYVPDEAQIPGALDDLRHAFPGNTLCAALDAELLRMGFKPHTLGTRQLKRALELVLRDEDALDDVLGKVYRPIARCAGSTAACIERNIRYAIESAWVKGDLSALEARFGYTILEEKGKPTNRAFLAQLSEHIRLHRA